MSLFKDGIFISPGTETTVALKLTITTTTQQARVTLSPKQRKCYFDDEFSLQHFKSEHGFTYSLTNCLYEAAADHILEST